MPVYRVVLCRLKSCVTEDQKQTFIELSHQMKKEIPGIISLELGPAADITRTKGFDFGIVVCFESFEAQESFMPHPTHVRLRTLREEMCEDSLAFFFQF